MTKVVIVTAHPDDESLWVGGILSSLSEMPNIDINLICITGANHPFRRKELSDAMQKASISNWAIMDHVIPDKGGILLNHPLTYYRKGLETLQIEEDDIDLLITHSPYGDEHEHIQHSQLFHELYRHCKDTEIPFSYFSFIPAPYYGKISILPHGKRGFGLHVIGLYKCFPRADIRISHAPPQYFVQFKVDKKNKNAMLRCYKSVDIEKHRGGYFAWTSFVEGLYLYNQRGLEAVENIIKNLQSPIGDKNCFSRG